MKKVLLLFYLSLLCLGINAQEEGPIKTDGTLSVSKTVSLVPGGEVDEDEGFFTIAFEDKLEALHTAYQMDIYLPDGFSFAIPEGYEDCVLMNENEVYPKVNRKYVHTLVSDLRSTNHLFVMVYDGSNKNKSFTDHSGDLFDVYVKASPYAKPGDFQITVKGIMFIAQDGTEDGQRYDYDDQTITAGTVSAESSIPVKVSSANKISTAIFPFSCALPAGLEAYTATGLKNIDDADYITLQKSESIAAFTPYILYAENGIDQTLSGEIDAANYPADGTVSDGYLTGVLKNTEASAGYVLQNKGQGVKFYKIGSTPFTIPAGKCFANPQSANAPALSFVFDDEETTSIQTASNLPHSEADGILYDLQGNRVLNPQSGHIYIINGQKVLKR